MNQRPFIPLPHRKNQCRNTWRQKLIGPIGPIGLIRLISPIGPIGHWRKIQSIQRYRMQTREQAWNLLCEWTEGDSLRKHARAVEHAMRTYARKYGEDEEKWGIAGMLHDFDYERYPDQRHPQLGSEVLRERGYPEDVIRAILSHADYTGVKRESLMEHAI